MKPSKSVVFSILLLMALSILGGCKKDCKKSAWKKDCVCTEVYDPVCGCDGRTYGNACEAECQSITKYTKGECK